MQYGCEALACLITAVSGTCYVMGGSIVYFMQCPIIAVRLIMIRYVTFVLPSAMHAVLRSYTAVLILQMICIYDYWYNYWYLLLLYAIVKCSREFMLGMFGSQLLLDGWLCDSCLCMHARMAYNMYI